MGKKKSQKLKKYIEYSDERIIRELKKDNNKALKHVINRYGTKIYYKAYSITQNHLETEEVLQDVLLSIYKNIDNLKDSKALSSWIYRITMNCSNMKLRQRQKNLNLLNRMSSEFIDITLDKNVIVTENSIDSLVNKEARQLLDQAISDLPAPYKSVILLNDLKHFSIRKTSDILNISVPAVKSRLHRARKKLKNKLDVYFLEMAN